MNNEQQLGWAGHITITWITSLAMLSLIFSVSDGGAGAVSLDVIVTVFFAGFLFGLPPLIASFLLFAWMGNRRWYPLLQYGLWFAVVLLSLFGFYSLLMGAPGSFYMLRYSGTAAALAMLVRYPAFCRHLLQNNT